MGEDLQRLPAVLGEGDRVPELLEGTPEEQPVHPVVVDHQKAPGLRAKR
jgi:hypothetical protein